MKKSRKKPQKARKQAAAALATEPAQPNRRALLRNIAVGAVVVGGVGWFGAQDLMAKVAESDLTKVGQGVPSVVQIHDPQCQLCRSLQREVRAALKDLDDTALTYLVANIRSHEGAAFANRHGVPHVTLLFFDAEGRHVSTLQGPNQRETLRRLFQEHAIQPPS